MIRATLALVLHSLTRIRAIVIGISLVLAGFQFLLTQVAAYLMRTQAFGLLASLIIYRESRDASQAAESSEALIARGMSGLRIGPS